jgi:hypothetical protein
MTGNDSELAQALSRTDPAITDPPPVKGSVRYSSILEAAMNNEPTRDDRQTAQRIRTRLRWTRRRLAIASAAVGVAAVALVIGMTVLPGLPGGGTAQATVKVQTVDGRYVIWFTKMAEDTKVIEDELASLGLDVKIDFVSASPSMVGTLVASDGGDGTEKYLPASGVADPVPGVSVPLDYHSSLTLWVGRPAEPGESYSTSPALGAEAPGEALSGSHIYNMKVKDALEILKERGLEAEWRDSDNTTRSAEELAESYVSSVIPVAEGRMLVFTEPDPRPDRPDEIEEALSAN